MDTQVRQLGSATNALDLKMLVDSGVTHSFINPKYLSDEMNCGGGATRRDAMSSALVSSRAQSKQLTGLRWRILYVCAVQN